MENKISNLLPQNQQQTITNYDYILTPEDEQNAINHEVSILRAAAERKAQGLVSLQEINQLLKTDFESKLDKSAIFERYNILKHRDIEETQKQVEKTNAFKKLKDDIKIEWTYQKFYITIKRHFEKKQQAFIFNDVNNFYIKAICYFLSDSSQFNEVLKLDYRKGLFIVGTTGLGKTEIIKAVKDNPLNPIAIYSMLDIADFVKKEGEFNLKIGSRIICLDDVGTEQSTVKYYGTDISWFKDFIENYYLNEHPFSRLIITTNLTGDQIEERYGKRVRSRMREMFNTIALKGEDLRK